MRPWRLEREAAVDFAVDDVISHGFFGVDVDFHVLEIADEVAHFFRPDFLDFVNQS